jgi:hypothetical protein
LNLEHVLISLHIRHFGRCIFVGAVAIFVCPCRTSSPPCCSGIFEPQLSPHRTSTDLKLRTIALFLYKESKIGPLVKHGAFSFSKLVRPWVVKQTYLCLGAVLIKLWVQPIFG